MPLQRERPKLPSITPVPLERLIKKCWDHEPFKRPSSHEVLRQLEIMIEKRVGEGGAPSNTPQVLKESSRTGSGESSASQAQAQFNAHRPEPCHTQPSLTPLRLLLYCFAQTSGVT